MPTLIRRRLISSERTDTPGALTRHGVWTEAMKLSA